MFWKFYQQKIDRLFTDRQCTYILNVLELEKFIKKYIENEDEQKCTEKENFLKNYPCSEIMYKKKNLLKVDEKSNEYIT